MMSCQEAVTALWRHLEDPVPDGDGARLEDHLGRCRRCCGEADFAGMLRDLWARTPSDVVPAPARDRFEALLASLEVPT